MKFAERAVKVIAVAAVLALSACDTAEERAEEHFREGLALLEAGDVDRALIEFRNVFKLDGFHAGARRAYAEIERDRGNIKAAYGHYLRLVEQYPDDFEARRALLEMAIPLRDWEEIDRHVRLASEQQPDDSTVRLGQLLLEYRESVRQEDMAAAARLAAEAEALKEELPGSAVPYEVTTDYYVRQQEFEAALSEVDAALDIKPGDLDLYARRLALLERMGDISGVETQLREMVEQFPDDPQITATLIRWYLSRDNIAAAEAFLRQRIDEDASTAERVQLVRFLNEFVGRNAALQELDRMIEAGHDNLTFRSIRAGLLFESGERDVAIDELTRLIETSEPSDEVHSTKVALARMLAATGNQVGARALVEEVLAEDQSHVDALKMRANWLVEQDETDEAIIALRRALDQSPRDPEIMTLMARAHERAGSRELMGEMLSLAVEASNNAPEESLRYARFLLSDEKLAPAENVLIEALRLAPNDVGLLSALGGIHISRSDWGLAQQVIDTLEGLDSPAAAATANSMTARLLAAQDKTSEVVTFLEELVDEGQGGPGAQVAIVRAHLQQGRVEEAVSYVERELQENPQDRSLRFVSAALDELRGNVEAAEETYRDLVAEAPEAVLAWRALFLLQMKQDRQEDAAQTLESALAENPQSLDLLWAKASLLQQQNEVEEAIKVYERMYEINSASPLVANNLASLLTTARSDAESLEQAYSIARRLRSAEVPAFQDTYGWIAYRRGEYEEALAHLEPASEGLPNDPLAQYHLGMAYAALDRPEEAVAQFRKAIEVAGEGSALPQIEDARARIEALTADTTSID